MLLNQYQPRPLFSDPRSGQLRSVEISISSDACISNQSSSAEILKRDRLGIYNLELERGTNHGPTLNVSQGIFESVMWRNSASCKISSSVQYFYAVPISLEFVEKFPVEGLNYSLLGMFLFVGRSLKSVQLKWNVTNSTPDLGICPSKLLHHVKLCLWKRKVTAEENCWLIDWLVGVWVSV